MTTDAPRFMPSEALITRAHDASWGRLMPGQRVTIIPAGYPAAEMRITRAIPHVDGGETYALRDPAVTDVELEAERAAFAEAMAGIASCGNCCPDGDAGPHRGGIVQGADGGDSIPVMIHPGEGWYSADEVRRMPSGETGP